MILYILLGLWALLYVVSLLLAKLAGEDKFSQPIIIGLIPIVGSACAIYSYCVLISINSHKRKNDE